MATLFDMYKDVATPDIYQETKAARQESEANTKKTMDTSFGMLKKSNIVTLQKEYREGKGRFAGITDPDKKFQVYYDALKALDPQSAQDAAKVYGEERERRISGEIAAAYKGEGGDPELEALTKAIEELESSIASDEASAKSAELENTQAEDAAIERNVNKTTPDQARAMVRGEDAGMNKSIDTGRMNQPIDDALTPDNGIPEGELQQDWSKLGYVPLPRYDLRRMYGINPEFDISLSREQPTDRTSEVRQQSTPTAGMEDYVPASRYDGYVPMTRRLANMYRGI